MEEKDLRKTLREGALELGVALNNDALDAFFVCLQELKSWNRKMNLTSIEGDREIVIRHFLDSLTVARFLKGQERLLDVGSGAGFPGIPLKIAMPGCNAVLLDSVAKKVHFIRHVVRTLGLAKAGGIEAVCGRVEDSAVLEKYAHGFDCVVSRAFSELSAFVTVARPYLAPGGFIVAMKGPAYAAELEAVDLSGFADPEVHRIRLPFTEMSTVHVVLRSVDGAEDAG